MKNITLLFALILIASGAQAGVISHSSGYILTVRDCPTATNEGDCITEAIYGNGSSQFVWDISYAESELTYNNAYSNGTLTLDPDVLSLPVVRFEVESDEQQRNGVNLMAYQEYTWVAADTTTLDFDIDFDFIMSAGTWGDDFDSKYYLSVLLVKDIEPTEFPQWGPFPTLGDTIAEKYFRSTDADDGGAPLYEIKPDEMFESQLSLSIEVEQGESFYLYTQLQAFAINGGYVDSLNTLKTSVSASYIDELTGNTVDITQQEIAQNLEPQNRAFPVNEPHSALIMVTMLGFLITRRRNKMQ